MTTISEERIQRFNDRPENPQGKYVLYWLDASLRQRYNSALEYAIELGHKYKKGVIVLYCLNTKGRLSSVRRARFVLEALAEIEQALIKRGIQTVTMLGTPEELVPSFCTLANALVMDCAYLRRDRIVRNEIARKISCACFQVEDNVVVPVEYASQVADYSAKTFRPKLMSKVENFLTLPTPQKPAVSTLNLDFMKLNLTDYKQIESQLEFPFDVSPAKEFPGGEQMAEKRWQQFLKYNLARYELRRNPVAGATSMLSPYLSFGCISPVEIVLQLRAILQDDYSILCSDEQRELLPSNIVAFQDEVLTRREMAINYVWYTNQYDSFNGLPHWSQRTLEEHSFDKRNYLCSFEQMENGKTSDRFWNRTQSDLVEQGWLPPHARMYWGKQPLLWTEEPVLGYNTALYLNDIYELDGTSPGGYAGVGWCYGLHDFPFHARPIWGYIRPMMQPHLKLQVARKN